MTLDPAVSQILAMMNQLPFASPPFSAEAMRAGDSQPMPVPKADVAEVRDLKLPLRDGGEVAARLYHPQLGSVVPVLVFFHGGGWVSGNIETHDPLARALAAQSGGAVISIDYPRAPEVPFPGPLNACYDAVLAIEKSAAELGVDAQKIAVGGDSAGGNLATAVCLKIRDEGGPAIAHQLLIYPVTDTDFNRQSYKDLGQGYFLSADMMKWFWQAYVGEDLAQVSPLAAPMKAVSLEGLPSATVLTAEYDPLRDEAEAYARRLMESGVKVEHQRIAGVIHGFASMFGMVRQADEAAAISGDALRKAWG